ncbi:MAG: hypothetical protein AAGA61_08270 [Pseudomonadota bacterium]
MTYPIVFIDFAGPDTEALKTFYSTVFAWDLDAEGNFTAPVAKTLKGAIRNDPAEKRLYIGVPDVEAQLVLIKEAGGSIDAPRFEVPGVVVLGLFRDPAGNPMGLVELDGDDPRVP